MDYREKIIHGNEALPIAIYEISPSHIRYKMKLHWHPEHEIVHVISGRFRLRLNDTTYDLQAGDVVFIQGGTIHSGEPFDCTYICILVNLPLLLKKSDIDNEFSQKLQNNSIKVKQRLDKDAEVFSELCDKMLATYLKKDNGYTFEIKGLIFLFFGKILNDKLYYCAKNISVDIFYGRMKTIIEFIQNNYSNQIKLSELAQLANMTPNHFCRCFKNATGTTPFAYLIDYRLLKARHALVSTDLSITDIAFECGFNDISYFIHVFRNEFELTPKKYRDMNKNYNN